MTNKIHNNLTIENLINTEWFDDFNKEQQRIIVAGLIANLDVSSYANPRFNAWQMEQIRLGLVSGLDVETYLNPNINFQEMNKIRKNLEGNK